MKTVINNLHFLNLLLFLAGFFELSDDGALAITIWIIVWIYIFPPVLYRILSIAIKSHESVCYSNSRTFMVWWIGAQLQAPFLRFPFLDELLRCIPGLYSAWLRLWGSKIGHGVFWSPYSVVVDRPFLNIGDHVLVGMDAKLVSHFIMQTHDENEFKLILKPVTVESYATIGGGAILLPGSVIKAKSTVKAWDTVRGS